MASLLLKLNTIFGEIYFHIFVIFLFTTLLKPTTSRCSALFEAAPKFLSEFRIPIYNLQSTVNNLENLLNSDTTCVKPKFPVFTTSILLTISTGKPRTVQTQWRPSVGDFCLVCWKKWALRSRVAARASRRRGGSHSVHTNAEFVFGTRAVIAISVCRRGAWMLLTAVDPPPRRRRAGAPVAVPARATITEPHVCAVTVATEMTTSWPHCFYLKIYKNLRAPWASRLFKYVTVISRISAFSHFAWDGD